MKTRTIILLYVAASLLTSSGIGLLVYVGMHTSVVCTSEGAEQRCRLVSDDGAAP